MNITPAERKKIKAVSKCWSQIKEKQVKLFCSPDSAFPAFECKPAIFTGGQYITVIRAGVAVPVRINNICKIEIASINGERFSSISI